MKVKRFLQLDILKNHNVQYECLDARDDYAAQMKKDENIGIFSNWDILGF
jgi:hypothetical protein